MTTTTVTRHQRKNRKGKTTVRQHQRKLKITGQAKKAASQALQQRRKLPKSKRFGINKTQAKQLGINSGVERAKQLIRQQELNQKDAERVAAFYQRFKNKKTPKAEGAIKLWGGRSFGRKAVAFTKKQ